MSNDSLQEPPPAGPAQPPAPPGGADHARDAALVAGVLRRDRKATAAFVEAHADPVYAYVLRRLAPRADLVDDLVQDVFVAALGSLHTFRSSSSLRSWMLGIARHKVEDYYRRRLREPDALPDESDDGPPAADLSAEELFDRERLEARTHDILRALPEPYSLALLWRYWENRSAREIAAMTGKTEKAVERLLARARERFRHDWSKRHG